jgi:hypothetical protein
MYISKFIFQTKDYQLVFVAYNAKHAELRRKSKDWLLRNQAKIDWGLPNFFFFFPFFFLFYENKGGGPGGGGALAPPPPPPPKK